MFGSSEHLELFSYPYIMLFELFESRVQTTLFIADILNMGYEKWVIMVVIVKIVGTIVNVFLSNLDSFNLHSIETIFIFVVVT